jgi:hypothetical protein
LIKIHWSFWTEINHFLNNTIKPVLFIKIPN